MIFASINNLTPETPPDYFPVAYAEAETNGFFITSYLIFNDPVDTRVCSKLTNPMIGDRAQGRLERGELIAGQGAQGQLAWSLDARTDRQRVDDVDQSLLARGQSVEQTTAQIEYTGNRGAFGFHSTSSIPLD